MINMASKKTGQRSGAPAPFWQAVAAGVSGLSNIASGLITNYGKQRRSQQKYDAWHYQNIEKAQMALSQKYNERNMELQNQYQIDAENRANAYNDPSAQLARTREAGMNPQAVMSDAGVQGSISSAPDSSSPQSSSGSGHAGTKDYSGLAKLDILGMIQGIKKFKQDYDNAAREQDNRDAVADSEVNKNNAEADRLRGLENRDVDSWQDVLRGIRANSDDAENQAEISKFNAFIKSHTFSIEIDRAQSEFDKLLVDIDNAEKAGKLTDEQAKYYRAATALKWAEERTTNQIREPTVENIDADTKAKKGLAEFYDAESALSRAKRYGVNLDNDLKELVTSYEKEYYPVKYWLERGLTFSEIADKIADSYYKFSAHSHDSAEREKDRDLRKRSEIVRGILTILPFFL